MQVWWAEIAILN